MVGKLGRQQLGEDVEVSGLDVRGPEYLTVRVGTVDVVVGVRV